ncbi:hypothetical protein TWF694_007985 [Orbilia ellipsospora]|uniref:Uncharacterized protein n=1 Tax=Orbilia ellipsospora TaxID=2528407 RepID=A0AAV9XKV2_9PEZI
MSAPEAATEAVDLSTELSSIPQAIKDINLRITSISKLYKEILSKIEETPIEEIEEVHKQPDILATELSSITSGAIKTFRQAKESMNLDYKRQAKAHSGDFEMALKRYQGILNQYIKKTKENLAVQYKIMKPQSSDSEIEETYADENPPLFSSNLESESSSTEWDTASKIYMAYYSESKKVETRFKELKEWLELVSEIKGYQLPAEEKKSGTEPEQKPEAEIGENEAAQDHGKPKKKPFKWLSIVKLKLGRGKT